MGKKARLSTIARRSFVLPVVLMVMPFTLNIEPLLLRLLGAIFAGL